MKVNIGYLNCYDSILGSNLIKIFYNTKHKSVFFQKIWRDTDTEEKFVKYRPVAFKGRIFYQSDYRHTDGELFPTVAKTLAECRHRRDKWIVKKEQGNNR